MPREVFETVFVSRGAPVIDRQIGAIAARSQIAEKNMNGLGRSQSRMAKNTNRLAGVYGRLHGVLGLVAASFGVRSIMKAANTYQTLENRIRIVSETSGQATRTFEKLFKLADDARGPIGGVVVAYERVSRATKRLGRSNEEVLATTATITKAVSLSGSTAEGARGALVQFGQALDADFKSVGQEMQSVREQTPRLFQAMVDGLIELDEISDRADFRKKLSLGLIDSVMISKALDTQNAKIAEEFDAMKITISQAFTALDNAWIQWIGRTTQATGVADLFAASIKGIANNFALIASAGIGSAGAFAAYKGLTGLKSLGLFGKKAAAGIAGVGGVASATGVSSVSRLSGNATSANQTIMIVILRQIEAMMAFFARAAGFGAVNASLGRRNTAKMVGASSTLALAGPKSGGSLISRTRGALSRGGGAVAGAAAGAMAGLRGATIKSITLALGKGALAIGKWLLLLPLIKKALVGLFTLLRNNPLTTIAATIGLLIFKFADWLTAVENVQGVDLSGFDKIRFVFFVIGKWVDKVKKSIGEFFDSITPEGMSSAISGAYETAKNWFSGFSIFGKGKNELTGEVDAGIFGAGYEQEFLNLEKDVLAARLRNNEAVNKALDPAQAKKDADALAKAQGDQRANAIKGVQGTLDSLKQENAFLQERIKLDLAGEKNIDAIIAGKKAAAEANKALGTSTSKLADEIERETINREKLGIQQQENTDLEKQLADLAGQSADSSAMLSGLRAGVPEEELERQARLAQTMREFAGGPQSSENLKQFEKTKKMALENLELQEELSSFQRGRGVRSELAQGGFFGAQGFDVTKAQIETDASSRRSALMSMGLPATEQAQALEALNRQTADLTTEAYKRSLIAANDWKSGIQAGLLQVRDSTNNFAEDFAQVTQEAFGQAEDALVKFAETGKLDFKGLIDSIQSDLLRLAIRHSIINPLSGMLALNTASSAGQGAAAAGPAPFSIGGLLGAYLSNSSASPGGHSPAGNGILAGPGSPGFTRKQESGGFLDSLLAGAGNLLSGLLPFAAGGVVSGPTPALVGEGGPEAIIPLSGGRSVPVKLEGTKDMTIVNNFHISAPSGQIPRETQAQIAARVGIETQRAMRRNT